MNQRLRALFDRSVRYLPQEQKFIVQVAQFRGQIEVEEAAFFVRSIDLESGRVRLSDGSGEALDMASLRVSRDGALLCRVKRDLSPGGLLARFRQSAQAEMLLAVDEGPEGPVLRLGGKRQRLPDF